MEIKSCPFCGSGAQLYESDVVKAHKFIQCRTYRCPGNQNTYYVDMWEGFSREDQVKAMIALWNRRATQKANQ